MNDKPIAKFEAQLERLVEGAFTGIFRRRLSAHDLAVKLARSMESKILPAQDGDVRKIAPDQYVIHLHIDMQRHLLDHQPNLIVSLTHYLSELVNQSGYRLTSTPIVKIIADADLDLSDVLIHATHSKRGKSSTAAMQPLTPGQVAEQPIEPHLIINGQRRIMLTEPIINIGRDADNHVVIDDRYISRHHLQIRLRFGIHTLFDVDSRGGTFVNDVRVMQHKLRSGDVIRIGESRIIYTAEDSGDASNPDDTATINSVF